MKILHLIDSFDYSGSARQLQLLGPALASADTSVEICCLGPTTPWLASLRQPGVMVHALDWTRWFDPSVLWNLRAVVREAEPSVIHVWRMPALRALGLVAGEMLDRVVLSATPSTERASTWWDRRLLGRVLCVESPPCLLPEKRCQDPFPTEKGPDTFSIACVGRLERWNGFREAIWAFDFIHLLFPETPLKFVGSGSQREALETLAIGLQSASAVRFLGPLPDATDVLRDADVVWIPSLSNRGRQTALEAMALGRVVVASDVPCLRALIDDGVTGFLVPPGEVIPLARRTTSLLRDRQLRDRVGAAARAHVEERFSRQKAVDVWREIYRRVAA